MPVKVNVMSSERKHESYDDAEPKTSTTLDKTSSKQRNESEEKPTGANSTNKQTVSEVPRARTSVQPQVPTQVIGVPYQSYGTSPFDVPPAPSGSTVLQGQQTAMTYQYVAPQQFVISCERGSAVSKEAQYPTTYDVPPPYYQCGWQYQIPAVVPTQQLQPYRYDPYLQMYGCCQQPGFNYVGMLGGNGCTEGLQDPTHQPPHLSPTSSSATARSRMHLDSSNLATMSHKGQGSFYDGVHQLAPTCLVPIPKESGERGTSETSAEIVAPTSSKSPRLGTTTTTAAGDLPRRRPLRLTPQRLKATPVNTRSPSDGAGDAKWYYRETHLSSDSGCISDNSISSRDDAEIGNELSSPTVNETSDRVRDGLSIEADAERSVDGSFDDSPLSSMDSPQQPPPLLPPPPPSAATPDDGGQRQRVSIQKHPQQARLMKPIPERFVNLLRAAAVSSAAQVKRLEGCPLFKCHSVGHPTRYDNYQDLVYASEIPQVEYAGALPPHQGTVWFIPSGYVQCHYQPTAENYMQGYGTGNTVQGLYRPGSVTYAQDPELSSPKCCVLGQYVQGNSCISSSLQSTGGSTPCQYLQGIDSTPHSSSDQHFHQELCTPQQPVPTYVIQVDSPAAIGQLTVHENEWF